MVSTLEDMVIEAAGSNQGHTASSNVEIECTPQITPTTESLLQNGNIYPLNCSSNNYFLK